jgi:hypothetical protein
MAYPRTHNLFGSTFGGIIMRQYWADLALWENFLTAHSDIRTILELGAFHGGMTLFLAAQAAARNLTFYTADRAYPEALDTILARLLNLKDAFILGDFWEDANERLLFLMHNPQLKPFLLYVDGGCKWREFQAFVPELSAGDYVVVHDYGTEFQPEHAEPVEHLLERVFWDECLEPPQPCLTRFWRRA